MMMMMGMIMMATMVLRSPCKRMTMMIMISMIGKINRIMVMSMIMMATMVTMEIERMASHLKELKDFT